jgi:hypothetical protein
MLTFPSAPYGVPVCQSPGFDNFIVKTAAMGASQLKPPKDRPETGIWNYFVSVRKAGYFVDNRLKSM